MNRRKFLANVGTSAAVLLAGRVSGRSSTGASSSTRSGGTVAIVLEPADPVGSSRPAQWAIGQLQQALSKKSFDVRMCSRLDEVRPSDLCVVVAGRTSTLTRDVGVLLPAHSEALAIVPGILAGRRVLLLSGSDGRGLSYAVSEIADAVALSGDPYPVLQPSRSLIEQPRNRVRSNMRLFSSAIEDKAWFNDHSFWKRYLSFLATQRFNRFHLALGMAYDSPNNLRDTYFFFAYPFFTSVPGYAVRATNLSDGERDRNLEMLRFISDQSAACGLDFQLGLWSSAYQWINSPNANHTIEGLTSATHAPYCRDALTLLLKECPGITGVTFRVHDESGVPEGSYDFWRTVFDGCVRSGRRIGIDMHAKGMDQATIDVALATGLPVTISPKFSAEHMGLPYHQAAIRQLELTPRPNRDAASTPSKGLRSFTRYSYADLMTDGRPYAIVHRIWPGTQRVLLWGDPLLAAAYSRASGFCDSAGCELFEPLSYKGRAGSGSPGGREGYADSSLRPAAGDFAKYFYAYRLFGRLLYNPDANRQAWQRQLIYDCGASAANNMELALAYASRILPLLTTAHLPSASYHRFWPEMYVNQPIVGPVAADMPYVDTPKPRRFADVSPLDPQLFVGVEDFVEQILNDERDGRYSPVEVAQWLEELALSASDNFSQAETKAENRKAAAFRRFAVDVAVQIELGHFFANKIRAAVLYALHERIGGQSTLDAALHSYRVARDAWARIVEATRAVYAIDAMTYGEVWFHRGHWSDRLAAIDGDIAVMAAQSLWTPQPNQVAAMKTQGDSSLIRKTMDQRRRPSRNLAHRPPTMFRRGEGVILEFRELDNSGSLRVVQLYYRHICQAEPWVVAPMKFGNGSWHGVIPAVYTKSPYPLQYYFAVRDSSGRLGLYPGFENGLDNQPYFVLRG